MISDYLLAHIVELKSDNFLSLELLSDKTNLVCKTKNNNDYAVGMVIRFVLGADNILIDEKIISKNIKHLHIGTGPVKMFEPCVVDGVEEQRAYILDVPTVKQVKNKTSFEIHVADNISKSTLSGTLDKSLLFLCELEQNNKACRSFEIRYLNDGMENDVDEAFDNIETNISFIKFKRLFEKKESHKSKFLYVGRILNYSIKYLHDASAYNLSGAQVWRNSIYVFEKKKENLSGSHVWILTHITPVANDRLLMPNACLLDSDNKTISSKV